MKSSISNSFVPWRPSPSHRLRSGLAAMCTILAIAPSAWGFRTLEDYDDVPDGARVRWPNGVFEFWTHDSGTASVSAEELAETSRRALGAWQVASCAHIVPEHLGISPYPAEPGDGANTIEIVEEDWESLGFPEDAAGANDIYFEERDDGSWEIVEADIYINAEHHRWSTARVPGEDERSLLGVLTHEAGHALGLLHPCESDGADGAPECDPDDAPSDLMSPYYEPDQVSPEEEDFAGLCYLYPACESDDDCAEGSRCNAGECVPVDADGDGVDDLCDSGSEDDAETRGEDCPENRPTGAECSESNQCEGGECVAGVEDVPICTVRCEQMDSVCPQNWTCANVEDRAVCLPPNEEAGCECSLARAGGSSTRKSSALWIVAGMGLLSVFHLRRTRRALSKVSCARKVRGASRA